MMQRTIGKEDFFTENVLKLGNDMIYKIDLEHKRLTDFWTTRFIGPRFGLRPPNAYLSFHYMVRSSDAVERWGQGWGSVCWQGQWVAQAKLAKPVGRVLPRNLMFSVCDPHLQRTDRFFHGPWLWWK